METKVINMTPHPIMVDNGSTQATYPPSGEIARVTIESTIIGEIDGFQVVANEVTGDNLPEPQDGIYLLVSAMVLGLRPDRHDLIAPNTGSAKRDENGRIVSVPGFVSN